MVNNNAIKYKDYLAVITIPAYCEEDFKEQLDSLDCYELEMWKEIGR